ncbi:site-specific integrase [Diaphorobacter sp. HDW4A]|uniref:tyrosine-type recombinase/integrase n=1 Tax=Diaphorobacter sp. HDW4A TaxID=2714924 RepID=UPI001F0DBA35|nr:site-specific integrase [Diaphorobacter sp. HDW4A]
MTAIEVSRLRDDGAYAVGGVSGLYLQVIGGSRVWVYRFVHLRQRRRMGLGSYPSVGLAAAREAARAAMQVRNSGADPITSRQKEREAARTAHAMQLTFAEAGEAFVLEHETTWKNLKHVQQWRATLATYAYPQFGKLNVSEIEQAHVLRALSPIWKTKTETATRLRGRIEQILDWATAHGHRTGTNPARWRGQLEHILANPDKVAPVQHHAAIPFGQLPTAFRLIAAIKGQSARALQFLILTASRSGEVRGMRWAEVDLKVALWIVPAERMKAGKEHRVPLSRQAMNILRTQPRRQNADGTTDDEDYVFPSNRLGPLSDMAFTTLMRRHAFDAVPHGFRSTFRDWAGETTHHPRDAVELCLAHSIDTKTEAAYRRADMLKKRAVIMREWTDYAAPHLKTSALEVFIPARRWQSASHASQMDCRLAQD